ncbi:hypothetical protein [Desulfurobacterium crinifex]
MEGREAMNTHNNQTPRILVAEEIEGKKVLHDVNSELDALYVNALKRLSKKKSKEQKTEPETEFQHEVVINPKADELAMVEGGEELKEEEETFHPGEIKDLFLWFLWAIYGFVTMVDIITLGAVLTHYPLLDKIPAVIIGGCLGVWWPLTLIYLFAVPRPWLKGTPYYTVNNEFANGFLFGYFLSRWWK